MKNHTDSFMIVTENTSYNSKTNSPYDTGITAQWPEQLITLTTCEYTQKDGRLLVVARKKTE